ncbi:GLPGLI family protein [Hanstruepera marina]|uniref:GLPGLI family protein n=1 Tax=Hanstruepera marina TaxID=2873265 RepID=UPI002101D934|nr:GLPGLI family protein [Hanstruepera marina]
MKLQTTKMPLIAFFLLITLFSFAQKDFQGKAYYQTKTTMDLDNWGGRQLSEQQKKQMMERMKSFLEKQYVLTFTQSESLYKEEEKLEAPGGGGRGFGMMSSFSGGAQYKNIKDKEILQDQEFFGKQFLVKDSLPEFEWEMGTETKQIGQYMCFKATAVKKVDEFDWSNMRRRDNKEDDEKKKDSTDTAEKSDDPMSEIEVPETITVTAWYTPQIPVNNGPGEYWGLPGLILEVSAGRTTMLCSKIVLNPEEKDDIKKPSKGKEVTRAEYNQIVKDKMAEMREMYGGRNRGGGRGR